MTEYEYVDPDDPFGDDVKSSKRPAKRMFGTTPQQKAALAACGRESFKNNIERNRFVAIEEFAKGMDPDSRVWLAWIDYKIKETAGLRAKRIAISLPKLMRRLEGKDGQVKLTKDAWFVDNRNRVLNPKGAKKIAEETGVQTGMDEMLKRAKKNK